MKIIKQEIQFEESLRQRLEFICEFYKVSPTISWLRHQDKDEEVVIINSLPQK